MIVVLSILFFFFKQKTAYEMRISDWSSDVCSSDLPFLEVVVEAVLRLAGLQVEETKHQRTGEAHQRGREGNAHAAERMFQPALQLLEQAVDVVAAAEQQQGDGVGDRGDRLEQAPERSEEHTSELQ